LPLLKWTKVTHGTQLPDYQEKSLVRGKRLNAQVGDKAIQGVGSRQERWA
jgi:hypothetical protein